MSYLYILTDGYRGKLVLLSMLSAIVGVSEAVFIALINYSASESSKNIEGMVYWFSLAVFMVVIFGVLDKCFFSKVGAELVEKLRKKMTEKILVSPLDCKERLGDSELLTIFNVDIKTISGFFTQVPLFVSSAVFLVAIMSYVAFLFGSKIFLLIILFIIFGFLLSAGIIYFSSPAFNLLRDNDSIMMEKFKDLILGFKELKMDNEIQFEKKYIYPVAENITDLTVLVAVRQYTALYFLYASIYFLIAYLIFDKSSFITLTSEETLGLVLSIIYTLLPIHLVMFTFPELMKATISARRILKIQNELDQSEELLRESEIVPEDFDHISLNNITFEYFDGDKELGPYDFYVSKGDVIFISGGNGSGKTTLIKLLCGLYSTKTGFLSLNGNKVDKGSIVGYRKLFSTVFSDFHIFKNIKDFYKLNELSATDISKNLLESPLLEKFGLDTILNKYKDIHPDRLSSGQLKKLAILIAVFEKKPICLFDEPAAELDPHFKKYFYTEFLSILREMGKTIIIITHDDAYYKYADRTVEICDGEIKENNDCFELDPV